MQLHFERRLLRIVYDPIDIDDGEEEFIPMSFKTFKNNKLMS